jgi:hypothetical protein
MGIDRPIVVLEHDAVMLKPYREHRYHNTVAHLGEPPHLMWNGPSEASSIRCINCAHAYAIDPLAARRLMVSVLGRGVYECADVMIQASDVAIIPEHGFATKEPGETTIIHT